MTEPTSNSARLAARPIDEGGTPVEAWMEWQRDFPALDVDDCHTLLLVAAHPDDETLGLGATAAMLSGRGVTVQLVAVTDGEAAYPDDSGGRKELAKVRRDELTAVAEVLGLPTPVFLRIPDGEVRRHERRLSARLGMMLAGFDRGTWCAATWRGDGHPDHESAGRAAADAAKRAGARFIEYPIWMWHWATSERPGRAVASVQTHRADAGRPGDQGGGNAVLRQPTGSRRRPAVVERGCRRTADGAGGDRLRLSRFQDLETGYLAGMELAKAVVVVPAHNEAAHLPRCLRALATATVCLPVPTLVVVVLDATDDGSERLVGQFGPDVHFVTVEAGNVGAARAAGFDYGRQLSEGVEPARIWYATTDADSVVPADWLLQMTAADADMVLGVVRVPAWRHYPAEVARRYMRAYQSKGPGHNHIHGANMGFRADAYWAVGGFRALPTGEDVELVDRFEAENMRIHRDAKLSVATSDRQNGRAPGGFAKHLRELSGSVRKKTAGASEA